MAGSDRCVGETGEREREREERETGERERDRREKKRARERERERCGAQYCLCASHFRKQIFMYSK